ncbi:hypothetical protein H4582DRAFT_2056749 [Lactarius indigo]|nr:hypothetical protein H4582DRAFT_2056749 [Lactarius indigo]
MGKNEDALNDPTLIRMKSSNGTNDPNDNIQPADHVLEGNNNRIVETTLEPNDVGFLEAVDDPNKGPGPLTQLPQGPVVSEENLAPSTQPHTHNLEFATRVSHRSDEDQPIPHRPSFLSTRSVKSTAMREDQDLAAPPMPSEPMQTPAPGPSDGQTPDPVHPNPPPINPAIPNLRLERAMANAEKKQKAKGKTTTAASKKQKTANGLAKPTSMITIKNICMCQWNERQPGSQGLAADFDAYFKGLSNVDKEPFKREMRTAQAATRKAKATSKKPSEAPSIN